MSATKQAEAQDKIRRSAQVEVYKSIAERKEVGIGALKGWDQTSRKNLQDMRVMIDSMYEKLKAMVEESNYRQEKLVKFFSAIKVNSSADFSLREHLPKFTLGPTKLDPKTKTKMPLDAAQAVFGGYLESLEKELGLFQANLNAFQKQIESNIVGKILVERSKELEAKLKELSGRKKELKARIKKLTLATKTSYDELFRQLYTSLGEANRVRRPTVNAFQFVFTFVNNVRKLSMEVREFGYAFVEIFKAAKALERERLASGRDAFFEFNAAMERTFATSGLQGLKDSEVNLRKISPSIWNADHFEPKEVISSEQADLVRQRVAANELTIETLRDFIAKEKIEENIKELFDHFVMRRFLVRESDAKSAAVNDVIVYLTVDYFYSIYQFNKATKKHAVLANVPIEKVTLAFKEGGAVVFAFEEPGFLWTSKRKVSLVFQGHERDELKTDHENFVGLLTIAQKTPDQLPQVVPQPQVATTPDAPLAAEPKENIPEPEQEPVRTTEVSEIEEKALGFSQLPPSETKPDASPSLPTDHQVTEETAPAPVEVASAPAETPSPPEPQESFGAETKMDEWEIE